MTQPPTIGERVAALEVEVTQLKNRLRNAAEQLEAFGVDLRARRTPVKRRLAEAEARLDRLDPPPPPPVTP